MELERVCVENVADVLEAAAVACPTPGAPHAGLFNTGLLLAAGAWSAARAWCCVSHALLLLVRRVGLGCESRADMLCPGAPPRKQAAARSS